MSTACGNFLVKYRISSCQALNCLHCSNCNLYGVVGASACIGVAYSEAQIPDHGMQPALCVCHLHTHVLNQHEVKAI